MDIALPSAIELSTAGFAAVAVLYAVLAVLLMFSWRGQAIGVWLIVCCAFTIVWAVTMLLTVVGKAPADIIVFVAELGRTGAWLGFLVFLLAKMGAPRSIRGLAIGLWILALVVGGGLLLTNWGGSADGQLKNILNGCGLILSLLGLLLVEQLHRNSRADSQRGIRLMMLGLGSLFAYDLFLYSQGIMIADLFSPAWLARGFANILFIPVITIAARSNNDWDLDVFVSRQVVYYSATLVAVGVYLLLMSAVGYLLVKVGGIWSVRFSLAFFIGAVAVIVLALFSAPLRARVKVFLSKHFFRNKYDYRNEWLRLSETLADFQDSSTRQIAIQALAQIVRSPAGLLWMRNLDRNTFQLAAAYNLADQAADINTDDVLVKFMEEDGWIIDFEEYRRDPEMYKGMLLPDWLNDISDAWLMVPLIIRKEILGIALLTRARGPLKLNYEDHDLLKTVANHVAVHLAQERSDSMLSEAKQFEGYNRLTAFLMHDLNNLIAQQSLILSNASKHKRNPNFVDDALATVANSVDRMERIMGQLKRRRPTRNFRQIDLRSVVSGAAGRCAGREPEPELNFADKDARVEVDVDQMSMVLAHLIQNAQEATSPTGYVHVATGVQDGMASVVIEDDGAGMTPGFIRDELFKPFASTKGSEGMGIGAYQAREFARTSGGGLEVTSAPGKGTVMTLTLPLKGR